MVLRDYQKTGVDRLRAAYKKGRRAPLFVCPTGGGKTFCFAFMALKASAQGRRVLILVHRQELLKQASTALSVLEVEHGLISPGHHGENSQVAVASIQTLDRRLRGGPVSFDFIIIDEAHHVSAATWARVLNQFPQAHLLGVTATPIRLDGRGLGLEHGGIFDDLILGPSVSDLIKANHLVKPVVYAYPNDIDVSGVAKKGGDYNQRELAERVDKPQITGCAVEHYQRLSPGEPAIAFCVSVSHAAHVANQFNQAGIPSAVIHGGLPDAERAAMISELAAGRIHVLTSVDLVSEGTDIPICSVAILLRKTCSLGLFLQMCGRILRPAPGKTRALVLDHVGNCLVHGLPDENRSWSLEGARKKKGTVGEPGPSLKQCRICFAVWDKGNQCPQCGHVSAVAESQQPRIGEGELRQITQAEIQKFKLEKKRAYARAQTYSEVLHLTRAFGDKPGFAHVYWRARKKARGMS